MSDGRCTSCGASVRAGADWCSLCYADLRPAPPPPPPPPPPVPVAAPALVPVAVAATPAGPDPLSAPYDALLEEQLSGTPLAPRPAGRVPTWPCSECDGANPIEETACVTCGSPFGARFATRTDSSARRDRMMRVLAGLGAFLAIVALLTYLSTPEPPEQKAPDPQVELSR